MTIRQSILGLVVIGCAAGVNAPARAQARPSIADLQAQIAALQENEIAGLASYLSVDTTDPARPALLVTGANLQVVNGLGTTGTVNGIGNVIVGYDEARVGAAICSLGQYTNQMSCENGGGTWAESHKSGSHNVVVGGRHAYSRYAGLVVGSSNAITGLAATVTGGTFNIASGNNAHISGGNNNTASGSYSTVTAGQGNTASASYASVSGGNGNTASGGSSAVSGGLQRTAAGIYDWVAGTLLETQ